MLTFPSSGDSLSSVYSTITLLVDTFPNLFVEAIGVGHLSVSALGMGGNEHTFLSKAVWLVVSLPPPSGEVAKLMAGSGTDRTGLEQWLEFVLIAF